MLRSASVLCGRHRITTEIAKGMTAGEPAQGKQSAAQHAMTQNGLCRIGRTRGVKTTGWRQHRRNKTLINAYGQNNHACQQPVHDGKSCPPVLAIRFNSGKSSAATRERSSLASPAFFFATATKSAFAGSASKCRRKNSRSSRLMRLRVTAFPTLRETAMPMRARAAGRVPVCKKTRKCVL